MNTFVPRYTLSDPELQNKQRTPVGAGSIVDDTYRLDERIASGGMGVILRGRHLSMNRDVAVKLMHAHVAEKGDFVQRFRREARVATLFNHPNITRVYDFGTTEDGIPYLVMELLDGEELQDLLDRQGALSLGRTLDLAVDFLDGLAEAHSMEVVHRDLKPSNIFLSRTNRGREIVKLLDFGIAKLVDGQSTNVTQTGMVAGTASYVAPERLIGAHETYAMDVYSAGLIILEMLMGRRVFDSDTVAQCLLMHLKKDATIPDRIARMPLGSVLRRATAKHPDDRYPDAGAFLDALTEVAPSCPRELRLGPDDLPDPPGDTTASLLRQVANGDGELDVLRRLTADESAETLPTQELSTSDLLETLIYHEASDEPATEVTPTRRGHPGERAYTDDSTGEIARPDITREGTELIGAEPRPTPRQDRTAPAESDGEHIQPWLLAAAAVVVVSGAALAYVLSSDASPSQPEPVTFGSVNTTEQSNESESDDTPTAPATSKTASSGPTVVRIDSEPTGADVYDGGELIGRTSFVLEVDPDKPPSELRFERDHHESATIEWPDDPGDQVTVQLDPVHEERPASARPARDDAVVERDPAPVRDAPAKRKRTPTGKAESEAAPSSEPRQATDEDVEAVLDEFLPAE